MRENSVSRRHTFRVYAMYLRIYPSATSKPGKEMTAQNIRISADQTKEETDFILR